MRSQICPNGLQSIVLFLGLVSAGQSYAFECTNAGAGSTLPDDNDVANHTACGDGAVAQGSPSTAVGASASATGNAGTAVGVSATASHSGSLALTPYANAIVLGSIPGVNDLGFNDYVDVGIGTSMPQAPLHVERADGMEKLVRDLLERQ